MAYIAYLDQSYWDFHHLPCAGSTLSGPATQVLLRRAFSTFGDLRYERLSQISVSHLYNFTRQPAVSETSFGVARHSTLSRADRHP
jgi:hypothetical protein